MSKSRKSRAASDDGSEKAVQRAAKDSAKAAATEFNVECADAAMKRKQLAPGAPRNCNEPSYLPKDGLGFLESVHRVVDVCQVVDGLLRSKDEKIQQKMVEQILDLAYGRNGRLGDSSRGKEELPELIFDVPRPESD
jgi:hypothetical protein